jgi:NAD(P)-dependent dehydrogenase (short-subunit alcohol dehydrogenase family)
VTGGDFELERVVVTGAARGIGFVVAQRFADEGARVALIDREESDLRAAAEKLSMFGDRIATVACDLSDADQIAACAETCRDLLGGVDHLVNNAGIGRSEPLASSDNDFIDTVLSVNLRAVLLLTRDLLPLVPRDATSSIVNISSQAAKKGQAALTAYSASKAGVLGFTISLAQELAPDIRVNAVCPGQVSTDMMKVNIEQTSREQSISYDEAFAQWAQPIPMKRFQAPEAIADAVLFLASGRAREITGEALNVSGGLVTW